VDTSEIVSTAALRSQDVPSPSGSLEEWRGDEPPELWRFARSYEPPADLPNLQAVASFLTEAAVGHWRKAGELPELGLGGLRLTLWWLFQQWRHTQSAGGWEAVYPDYASYVRAAVTEIHKALYEEESWWWAPSHSPTDDEREHRALARANETEALANMYADAAELLDRAIERREAGDADPLNLALIEYDVVRGAQVDAAFTLACGLTVRGGGRTLEEAQDVAYERSAALRL
jgi:hypothetical protein